MKKGLNEKEWTCREQSWEINTNYGGYLLSATPETKQYNLLAEEK